MKKQPKKNYVIAHLLVRGNISSWEAITAFRHTRLAQVIHELREDGAKIETLDEKHEGGTHARYILIDRKTLVKALPKMTRKNIQMLLQAANDPDFEDIS